ncbi:MAG: bifunctional 3,4-dihydroxy-2-butanone-4-phosphate synthase/GTP cyclohydrolase II [Fibrobacterales bacterium]|nr:bifunctional 3,4-dihydroxy-2-butanone-4-phosphate synthase/GTP cyclohydrolase II [Fibrobacterales bacterium]MBP5352057.1 bifunctional 3,4-dihydroxy-2-butanone-4-phosphate synthase/GTP cyclohydrolase II [Fibrobacterales bacterium]
MLDSVEKAVADIAAGKLVLVVDDENRENEGDLVCAAKFATPEAVNFMATHAKGLICMPMSAELCRRLDLPQMVSSNTDNHQTAFTVSIDHVSTTTGISAVERSATALAVADPSSRPEDFRRPGHMFPLEAREGGVLKRTGHTEATVDLCRLAGLEPVGLCCEIMRDDGTMMRMEELSAFAKKHGLSMVSVADIVSHRLTVKRESLVERVTSAKLPTKYGNFTIHGFVNRLNGEHHIALSMGDIADGKPVLCRIHSECLTGDALGSARCDCGEQYAAAMRAIAAEGRGLLVYMRQEGRGIGLINKIRAYALQDEGYDTYDANIKLGFPADLRDYGIGAQIIVSLGVGKLRLMTNNPKKITGLKGFGLEVSEVVPIEMEANDYNRRYLRTKRDRFGHILSKVDGKEEGK